MRACCNSAFSSDRFTLDGHSTVQALQDRQLFNATSSSSETSGSPLMPRNSSAARMPLARPRVDMISNPVAMKVGHMLGVSLRHSPQPLHCSRLAVNEPSLAANARRGPTVGHAVILQDGVALIVRCANTGITEVGPDLIRGHVSGSAQHGTASRLVQHRSEEHT